MMRILVLGGRGFIGRHLVEALVSSGHSVRVMGRSPFSPIAGAAGVEYLTGDFGDEKALSAALEGVEVVYHLISTTVPATSELDPAADVRDNLVGTLGLLAAMQRQGIHRLIYMSSGGTVYGRPDQLPIPETHPLRPIGSYGIVKVAIEGFLARASRYGLVPVVLRAANAYGPHQTRPGLLGFVDTVLHRVARDEAIELMGDGSIIRDFLHVRDLADLCVRALAATEPVTLNAGSGRGTALRDVIALAEQLSGRRVKVINRPEREIDVPVSILDIRRARDLFGWEPAISLKEGMADTLDWVQSHVSRETPS